MLGCFFSFSKRDLDLLDHFLPTVPEELSQQVPAPPPRFLHKNSTFEQFMEELSSSYLWHRLFWPGAGACSPRSCPAGGGQDCVSPCRHRPLPPSPSELNKKEHKVGHAAQAVGNVYAVHAALEGTGSRQCCTRGNCVSYAVLHKNKREQCVVGSAAQEGTVCVVRSAAQEGTVCSRDVKA